MSTEPGSLSSDEQQVLPECSVHGAHSGDVLCHDCYACVCWSAAVYEPTQDLFLCPSCKKDRARRDLPTVALGLLRHPATYVAGLVFAAAVMYVAQPRNGDAAAAPDTSWHRQETGRKLFNQVQRSTLRVHYLYETDRTRELRHWAKFTADRLKRLRQYWSSVSSIQMDLAIAHCVMRAYAGQPQAALQTMNSLEPKVLTGENQAAATAYRFQRGRIALLAGEQQLARSDWQAVYQSLEANASKDPFKRFQDKMDELIDRHASGRNKGRLVNRVRMVCGTRIPGERMREEITQQFDFESREQQTGEERTGPEKQRRNESTTASRNQPGSEKAREENDSQEGLEIKRYTE